MRNVIGLVVLALFFTGAALAQEVEAPEVKAPELSREERLTLENLVLKAQTTQLQIRLLQVQLAEIRLEVETYVKTLEKDGYVLDLDTLTYLPIK